MTGSFKKNLRTVLGERNYLRARHLYYLGEVASRMFHGDSFDCNVCGFNGRFRAFGHPPRYGAQCPNCGSFERHRLLKSWTERHHDHLSEKSLLHFAPESAVVRFLKPLVRHYQTADLNPHHADLVLNLEEINLPDRSVDIVLASHVLEHVNDRVALREIKRILTPAGFAILMVPIVEGWDQSYEDASITNPTERTRHFGQWDHVRMYGHDLRDRIREAGFSLEEFTAVEPDVQRLGLWRGEKIFVANNASEAAES